MDGRNLVYRAAERFLAEAGLAAGVRIHLDKRLPLSAGLGGGSANAAVTLRALNELFGSPLGAEALQRLAAGLGSDVPFFLQDGPALATGRGERVEPLDPFPLLRGRGMVVVHPGFGVSTPWAYQELARFPEAQRGREGRAREALAVLRGRDATALDGVLYNALEFPVLEKYPLLQLFQEFFRGEGVLATRMSGSGSSTFAITGDGAGAARVAERFRERFGTAPFVGTGTL